MELQTPTYQPKPAFHKSKKLLYSLMAVVILAIVLGLYFLLQPSQSHVLRNIISKATQGDKPTVADPLNGVLYTKNQASVWQNRSVLGVMVENLDSTQVRPQAGLSNAEVV